MGITCFGGAERLLYEELKFFKKMDIETKILTFKLKKEALDRYYSEIINDIEVIDEIKLQNQIYMLRKKLIEINPDIVITASGKEILFLAVLCTKIPYIIHLHGTLFWFHDELIKYAIIYRRIFNKIINSVIGHKEFIPIKPQCSLINRIKLEIVAILDYLAVRKAKEIIVLTPQVQWEVEKLYKRKSIIARGCLSPVIFNHKPKQNIRKKLEISDDAKIILSVSRLDPRKRLDVLMKSFITLSKKVDKAILIIVGTGPDEERLKSLAKQLNCSDTIVFTGFVNDDELWDYYHACDVFACPAWMTSPITTYEALAFNKKVVWSSEASEPDEILNSPLVYMANPNPDSFAD
ncbi:unnamed protein product, partial [marine sediment metagenome]